MKAIVSDTTSLIVLEGLEALDLLCKVFNSLLIPKQVLLELQAGSPTIVEKLNQVNCFEIIQISSSELLSSLLIVLDKGKAQAITLALEKKLPLLIDERKGRSIAQQKGLVVTGFVGLLTLALKKQIIDTQKAHWMLDQAIKNGFRPSEKLYKQVVQSWDR